MTNAAAFDTTALLLLGDFNVDLKKPQNLWTENTSTHTTSRNLLTFQLEFPPQQKHSLITFTPEINAAFVNCVSLSMAAVVIYFFFSHGIKKKRV